MSPSEFQARSGRLFGFLEKQYGFRRVEAVEAASLPAHLRGYYMRYENDTTGISIHLEPVEQLPVVHIQRLKGRRETHSLGLLLLAAAPHLNPLASERSLPLAQNPRTLLRRYAEALRGVGGEVLRGNFDIFPRLRGLRKLEMRVRAAGRPLSRFF